MEDSENSLRKIRNLGTRSEEEIIEKLTRLKQHGINRVRDLYATNPKNEP